VTATPPDDLAGSAVGLARTLRAAGVDASPDRVHAFLAALDGLGATSPLAVYWAGRLTLCGDHADLDRYDRVFAAYFDAEGARLPTTGKVRRRVHVDTAAADHPPGPADGSADDTEVLVESRQASAAERLRHRDVAHLDAFERAELHRLLAATSLPGETRRSRRHRPARRGDVDRRRTVRRMLEAGGEPGVMRRREPRPKPRRVVLLVDVSGSMGAYADVLLRFAHATVRGRAAPTEVFTLGTRLTRVTAELSHRDPDTAMRAVSAAIPDWSGGTRLADTLRTFLDRYGQPGVARGAIAVVLSDGWETGDAAALGEQMARLRRLAHRVVWANPRAGRPGFEPTAAGMAAALPHCDQLVEGHSLGALEDLARIVAGDGRTVVRAERTLASRNTVTPVPSGGRAGARGRTDRA
jgi:uncharacterized protein